MSGRGVVAAGHPLTAEAGARVLREGGNAVDAAIAAVLASCVTESPLTGLGAGGYMLVHEGSESVVLDFFVAVPGLDGAQRSSELVPIPIYFTPEVPQVFHIGAASCGVPGMPAGLAAAAERFGSMPLAELAGPAASLARGGVRITPESAFFLEILAPILTHYEEAERIYAPHGKILGTGDEFVFAELGDALERFGAEGAAPFYGGDIARAMVAEVRERGGTLGLDDLAAYEPIAREPIDVSFRGRRVLTNPPPSSGGILIAYALALLERLGESGTERIVAAMEAAQAARSEDFLAGLLEDGFASRFLDPERVAQGTERVARALAAGAGPVSPIADDALGSTTHITAVDGDGGCASVTCSNGTGSGLIAPGTGVHVNNMLGEQDLNPHGFHRHAAGVRLPSMMSPSVVLNREELEAGLGSGGSNRIRSAILQTVVRLLVEGDDVADAVVAPRVHFEDGAVQAEPGVDQEALGRLEERGYEVARWHALNVFFGGVHAVARDPATGELSAGGDPRRGGAVAFA